MVLKIFAAVPGSTILEAPQGTGRRNCSLPFLSFPYSRKPAVDLNGCHKGRKGQAKLIPVLHSTSNCFCLPAEAQLNASHCSRLSSQVPTWQQDKPATVFTDPNQDQRGQSSWIWQSLTTDNKHFAYDHTRGWYLRERFTAHSSDEPWHTYLPAGQSSAQSTSTSFWRP